MKYAITIEWVDGSKKELTKESKWAFDRMTAWLERKYATNESDMPLKSITVKVV